MLLFWRNQMALSLALTASAAEKSITQVIQAMFAVQPGFTILKSLAASVDGSDLTTVSDFLVGFASNTDSEAKFAAEMAKNIGLTEEAGLSAAAVTAAVDFFTAALTAAGTGKWGSAIAAIATDLPKFANDATYGAAITKYMAAVNSSLDYSLVETNTAISTPTDPSTTFALTTGLDALTGTDGNDLFNAFIVNNADTAQSGDVINGGNGMDTLFADMGTSQAFATTLQTNSVEKFLVRAQANDFSDNAENNVANGNGAVQVDAERMVGANHYETNNSRADVAIEDVRIFRKDAYNDSKDQVTKDVTVAMVSTDPGDVDFAVYFDQHSLVAAGDSTTSTISMNVGNQIKEADFDAANPLKDIPYTHVAFNVNGTDVVLTLELATTNKVTTYDQLFVVIEKVFNAEKATNPLLANVTLARTIATESFFSKSGELRAADEYVLTISDGTIKPAVQGWFANSGLPSNNAFSAVVEQGDATVDTKLITSSIILDDVGRGSMGGDLIVGGLSTGETSDSKGVERFEIVVERSSELQEINSTNNTLQEVTIVNGAKKGNLVVAGDTNFDNDRVGSDADAFGFTDVRLLDASTMTGSVSINAGLSGNVVGKYLNLKDTATNAAADNKGFIYDLGTNNDTLNLNISNANLAAAGTTNREDFYLNIDGNAGNDAITTMIGDGAATDATNWYVNSKINANLTVNGNAGDDTIKTTGAGDFKINGGEGNDTVYANNDGIGGTAAAAVNEVQTLKFSAVSAATVAAGIIVHGVNVALAANDTAAIVAGKVVAALAGNADFNGAGGSVIATGDSVAFTFDNTAAAAVADRPAIVVTERLATNSAATVVQGAATGSAEVAATAEVTNLTFAGPEAIGATVIFDGVTVTLVDTDSSGAVQQNEVAAQFAAQTFANFTVTATDFSQGTVQVTAKVAGADLSGLATIAAANISVADITGTKVGVPVVGFGASGIVGAGANGADLVAAVADGADVFTFNTANQTGVILLTVDVDGDPATANTEINVSATAGDSNLTIAAAATTALTSALGANWTVTNNANGTVNILANASLGAIAASTATDGTVLSATTITETTTGVEATTVGSATWAVNAVNSVHTDLQSNPAVANGILLKSSVTVTLSGARFAKSGVINDAANDFTNGFESKVVIGTTNSLGSQLQVNQAIKEAINGDSVLSKLLVATDGPSNTLVITSLVDGKFEANDLEIKIAAPSSYSTADLTSLNAAHKDLINNSSLTSLTSSEMVAVVNAHIAAIDANGAYTTEKFATDAAGLDMAGTASISVSDNQIDLGTGDDVVVLGTDATSNDTLIYSGVFGNDSVFNFVNTASDTGLDMLDFTAYLTNETSSSNSTASAVRVATSGENTGVAASVLTANEVATVNDFASVSGESWSGLDAADLLKAIKNDNSGSNDYGNITKDSFNVAAVSNLVGSTQKGIIMIENNGNDGEYKVFATEASSSEFTKIELVGTIDFGDTIDASVAGALV